MENSNPNIICENLPGILRIEICRPEKKNAFTQQMYGLLADAIGSAETNNAVRVILIHGQNNVFSAGNDLGDFLHNPPNFKETTPPVIRVLNALISLSKPIIAAAAGDAVGIGTTLLLHCDLIYAGDSAKFHLPFVNLGLCPEAGSSMLLPALVGYHRAAELILLGEPCNATKALEIGLVNAVIADSTLLDYALAQAQKLAAQPPAAVRLAKQLLKRSTTEILKSTMQEEQQQFANRLQSPEAKEAFTAFLEKRKPNFSEFK